MFRITEDPSSRSFVQRLAKNYRNDSIVSVGMDRVGVMVAYCDLLCICVPSYTVNYTNTQRSQYVAITPTLPMTTDTIESFL